MKIFYKARLYPTESGLLISFTEYYLVRETPCFYMCVSEINKWQINNKHSPITNKQIKRIHKTSGRFAFDTKEKAIAHLRMLKSRQIGHLEREITLNKLFLDCKELPEPKGNYIHIPESKATIDSFFRFD